MRCFFLFIPLFSMANPTQPTVFYGDAKFQGKETLVIEASDRAVIHWQDFSIEVDEKVQFIQPAPEALVLNRVIDSQPSRIMGKLESNGKVVLVNPSGILVGKEGTINTASLIASTLDIHNQAFIEKGDLACREVSWAMVVNEGRIEADEVFLMGFEVQNKGAIEAKKAALIGGKEVWLKQSGQGFAVRTRCTAEESKLLREMLETEQNFYAMAFQPPEDEEWPVLQQWNGAEGFNMPSHTAVSRGSIHAEEVQVLGDYIDLRSDSFIDASGPIGGTIFIGEGNEEIKNARMARVAGEIRADALSSNLGGTVFICGEGAVLFLGKISAKSGGIQVRSGGYFVNKGKIEIAD